MIPTPFPLPGASNFRDLGGYRTRGGGTVRHGRIFRSGSLTRLDDAALKALDVLGIRTVCDLRTRAEVARAPAPWATDRVRVLACEKPDTQAMLAPLLALGEAPEAEWRAAFATFYGTIPEVYAEEYTALFGALAEGETPLLVNCSAGKDRTGVACALILLALDVPMDQVVLDYLESGARLRGDPAFTRMLSHHVNADFERLPAHAQALLLGVDAHALAAALDGIDRRYGSLSGYFEQRLGIDDVAMAGMREALVEPGHQA